ncbi:MAG: hypothetical protein ACE14M_03290 [Terriglobales bacterium]
MATRSSRRRRNDIASPRTEVAESYPGTTLEAIENFVIGNL